MPNLFCNKINESLSIITHELGWDDFIYIFSLGPGWFDQNANLVVEASVQARKFYNDCRSRKIDNSLFRFEEIFSDLPQMVLIFEDENFKKDQGLMNLFCENKWRHAFICPTYGFAGALGYLVLYKKSYNIPPNLKEKTLRRLSTELSQFNAWSRALVNGKNNEAYLSPRETECILLVSGGKTSKQIASSLAISQRTVEFHIQRAMQKLGVSTRSQAAAKFSINNLAYG